jgi:hypothetical protein
MFFDLLEAGHLNGKPLHIADPKTSMFDIISSTDYQALSTQEIQDKLHRKHIVITGRSLPNVKFDKEGLRTLCPLNHKVSIQGTNSTFHYDRQLITIHRPLNSQ